MHLTRQPTNLCCVQDRQLDTGFLANFRKTLELEKKMSQSNPKGKEFSVKDARIAQRRERVDAKRNKGTGSVLSTASKKATEDVSKSKQSITTSRGVVDDAKV